MGFNAPNRFGSRSAADGRRVDQNFRFLEENLGVVDERVTTVSTDLGALEGDVTTIIGDVGAIDSDLSALTLDVADLATDLATLDGVVAAIDTDLGTAEADIVALQSDVDGLYIGSFASVFRGSMSIPNNTTTNIQYTTEHYDDGAWHDNATNPERLIVPVDGYYRADATAVYGVGAFTAGTTRVALWIWTSIDSVIAGTDIITPQTGNTISVSSPIRFMSAGSYFVAQTYHNAGAARNVTSYFSAHLVGLG